MNDTRIFAQKYDQIPVKKSKPYPIPNCYFSQKQPIKSKYNFILIKQKSFIQPLLFPLSKDPFPPKKDQKENKFISILLIHANLAKENHNSEINATYKNDNYTKNAAKVQEKG